MKKSVIAFLVSLTLVGCGSDKVVELTSGADDPLRFKIADSTWQVVLPTGWTINDQLAPGTVLIAHNQDQNFIIAEKPDYSEEIISEMITFAQNDFFELQDLKQNGNSWSFRGKRQVNDPERVFMQKITPIAGATSFLVGLCSYEFWEGRTADCDQVLAGWSLEATEK